MLAKTRGIVINRVRYSDAADVVSFYSRDFGRVTYMVYRSKSKKSVSRNALLQPLSILELEVKHLQSREIQRVMEMRRAIPLEHIASDPIKNSLALFMSEVINKVMLHSEQDEGMYLFLEKSICKLDCCTVGVPNFHLVFLVDLLHQLGISPNTEDIELGIYFDLINGRFTHHPPHHGTYLQRDETILLRSVIATHSDALHCLTLSREKRVIALESLLSYFKVQLPDFQKLKSIEVLKNLWD